MAIKIGTKVYRNIQEQVKKNMEDIQELKENPGVIIDDSTTSSESCWSSQKTNNELNQLKGIGVVYATSATPTVDGDSYIFNKTDFITEPLPTWTAIVGKQVCQIVTSKIKYIYSVVASNTSTITCVLIGEVGGGGSTLYQHNIEINLSGDYTQHYRFILSIISTNNTPFTKSTFLSYLSNAQFNNIRFTIQGQYIINNTNTQLKFLTMSSSYLYIGNYTYDSGTKTYSAQNMQIDGTINNATFTDYVTTL